MGNLSFLDRIEDGKIYRIHFKYFLHRGKWMYLFGNQHFTYGGMLPNSKCKELSNLFGFTILPLNFTEKIREYYGDELRIILKRIGEYGT